MAKVSKAFQTYDAVANREDLSDVISNIDPFDTPIMTAIGRGKKATNTTFEWQTESLRAANGDNAKIEGEETTRVASDPTVRISNVCQIVSDNATVSGTQKGANPAGKSKGEMAHQMAKVSKALKRDVETIISNEQARDDGDGTEGAETPRKTRALEHWFTTNVDAGTGYVAAADQYTDFTDGTLRNFTETILVDTLQTMWEAGAEPKLAFMGPSLKRTFSGFTGRAESRVNVAANRVVKAVDFYLSDFGEIKVFPHRFMRGRTVLLIDPEYASMRFYRPWQRFQLGKIGDADTNVILAEFGVECKNEKAHAKIADVQAA